MLGKVVLASSSDQKRALNGTDGRESPAASALTLVLDGGNSSSGNPIDVSVDAGVLNGAAEDDWLDLEGKVLSGELLLGHVRELVKSLLVGVGLVGIEGKNFSSVLEEDGLAVGFLELAGIGFAVVSLPLLEAGLLGSGLHVKKKQCGDCSEQNNSCGFVRHH